MTEEMQNVTIRLADAAQTDPRTAIDVSNANVAQTVRTMLPVLNATERVGR